MLLGYLDVHFRLKRPPAVRYRTRQAVAAPTGLVLSALAYAGQSRPEDIQRAFQAGAVVLGVPAALVPRGNCTFAALDAALADCRRPPRRSRRGHLGRSGHGLRRRSHHAGRKRASFAVAAALACPVPLGYTA